MFLRSRAALAVYPHISQAQKLLASRRVCKAGVEQIVCFSWFFFFFFSVKTRNWKKSKERGRERKKTRKKGKSKQMVLRLPLAAIILFHTLLGVAVVVGISCAIIIVERNFLSSSARTRLTTDIQGGVLVVQSGIRKEVILLHEFSGAQDAPETFCFGEGEADDAVFNRSSLMFKALQSKAALLADKTNGIVQVRENYLPHSLVGKGDTTSIQKLCSCSRHSPDSVGTCQVVTSSFSRAFETAYDFSAKNARIDLASNASFDMDIREPSFAILAEMNVSSRVHISLPRVCSGECVLSQVVIPMSMCVYGALLADDDSDSVADPFDPCPRSLSIEMSTEQFVEDYASGLPSSDSYQLVYEERSELVILSSDHSHIGKKFRDVLPTAVVSSMGEHESEGQNQHHQGYAEADGLVVGWGTFDICQLSLRHVQLSPRSVYYGIADQQVSLVLIIAIPAFAFMSILSLLLWMAVKIPLRGVARDMTQASQMIVKSKSSSGVPWLFIDEVASVAAASELLHERLQELRAFVPMNLFEAIADGKSAAGQSSSTDDAASATNPLSSSTNVPPEDATGVVVLASQRTASTLSPLAFFPRQQHSGETSNLFSLRHDLLERTGASGFSLSSFSVMHVGISYDWNKLLGNMRHGDKKLVVETPSGGRDTRALTDDVNKAVNPIVKVIVSFGGVLELLRPDHVIASFGAHREYNPSHQLIAARCALAIVQTLPSAVLSRVAIALDSGSYFVGTCGTAFNAARVIFGERFSLSRKLVKLGSIQSAGRIVLTDSIAVPLLDHFHIIPIDCVLTVDTPHPVALYELQSRSFLDKSEASLRFLARYKQAFSDLCSGRLEAGVMGMNALRVELAPHAGRLADLGRALLASNGGDDGVPFLRVEQQPFSTFNLQRRMTLTTTSENSVCEAGGDPGGNRSDENVRRLLEIQNLLPDPMPTHVTSASPKEEGPLFELLAPQRSDSSSNPDPATFDETKTPHTTSTGDAPLRITDKQYGVFLRSLDTIGTGAFSKVYRGLSPTGTLVALKYIDLRVRFINEADLVTEINTACGLRHECIVNHMSWVISDRHLVLIMEYVPGGSLKSVLVGFGKLSVSAVRRYISDTLMALEYLHQQGIVHCDVKPQNLLIAMDGKCKLSDFGSCLCCAAAQTATPTSNAANAAGGSSATSPGMSITSSAACMMMPSSSREADCFSIRGTSVYMAPEVARGETPSAAADIWSLGITTFELLTGRLPWEVSTELSSVSSSFVVTSVGSIDLLLRNEARFQQLVCQGVVQPSLQTPHALHLAQEAPHVMDLITKCLLRDPKARPTASELLRHTMFM
jgi:serine/threonine protein kinase